MTVEPSFNYYNGQTQIISFFANSRGLQPTIERIIWILCIKVVRVKFHLNAT